MDLVLTYLKVLAKSQTVGGGRREDFRLLNPDNFDAMRHVKGSTKANVSIARLADMRTWNVM